MKTALSLALAAGLITGSTGTFACEWQKSASNETGTKLAATTVEQEGMSTFDPQQVKPEQAESNTTTDGKVIED